MLLARVSSGVKRQRWARRRPHGDIKRAEDRSMIRENSSEHKGSESDNQRARRRSCRCFHDAVPFSVWREGEQTTSSVED